MFPAPSIGDTSRVDVFAPCSTVCCLHVYCDVEEGEICFITLLGFAENLGLESLMLFHHHREREGRRKLGLRQSSTSFHSITLPPYQTNLTF